MDYEFSIKTEENGTLSVSGYDEESIWFHLMHKNGTAYTILTRDQTEVLIVGLQRTLSQ
jgi:hypothetical protein